MKMNTEHVKFKGHNEGGSKGKAESTECPHWNNNKNLEKLIDQNEWHTWKL